MWEESSKDTRGPLPGPRKAPKLVRGPEASSFISCLVNPYLTISPTWILLKKSYSFPFFLPPALSLPQAFI